MVSNLFNIDINNGFIFFKIKYGYISHIYSIVFLVMGLITDV